MSDKTKIEWCDATVNFWWGCSKVSPACEHCYAESWSNRRSGGKVSWGPKGKRWLRTDAAVKELKALEKSAAKSGTRKRVFINSMSDVWEGCGPDDCYDRFDLDPARVVLLEVIAECPHLDFLLLTKRPGNVLPFFERLEFDGPQTRGELMVMAWMKGTPPENVWIGTTVEDQAHADERIPKLLAIPAKVRFLSCEPLLQELRIDRIRKGGDVWLPFEDIGGYGGINWVICGGESGHGARPLHPAWARSLRDQCENAGVAFFFKQWGEWVRNSDIHTGADKSCIVEFDADQDVSKQRRVYRVGKKRAGRLLDGIEHSSFPMEGHEVS